MRPLLTTHPSGAADPFQEQPADHSGLDFAYGAGMVRDDNNVTAVAASTVTLTDATTNYIEVTGAGSVSANTTGFTTGRIPLFTVVTAAGAISTVTDRRAFLMLPGLGGGGTGDASWTDVSTFTNSWVNYGIGTFPPARYRKDGQGFVHLGGVIKSGTMGSSAFTLPAGYRPSHTNHPFAIASNGAFGRVNVKSDGTVVPADGSNIWFALEGVVFYAV